MFIQRSLRSYQRHFTEAHRETVTQKICPICSKSFLRPGDLKLHLAKAHLLSGAALADSLSHSTSELLPNPSFICPGNFLPPRPRLPLSITCHPSPDMSSLSPDMSDSTLPDTLYMAIDTCPSAISTLRDSGEPVGILPVVGSQVTLYCSDPSPSCVSDVPTIGSQITPVSVSAAIPSPAPSSSPSSSASCLPTITTSSDSSPSSSDPHVSSCSRPSSRTSGWPSQLHSYDISYPPEMPDTAQGLSDYIAHCHLNIALYTQALNCAQLLFQERLHRQ